MEGNSRFFVHTVLWELCHTHLFVYRQWLLSSCKDRLESLGQRPSHPQNCEHINWLTFHGKIANPWTRQLKKKKDILWVVHIHLCLVCIIVAVSGKYGPQEYIYIYICVCICICIYIHTHTHT